MTALIVAPASVGPQIPRTKIEIDSRNLRWIGNWKRELKKWCEGIRVKELKGTWRAREKLLKKIADKGGIAGDKHQILLDHLPQ